MQAVILAAGRGSRLGELTRNSPKPLLLVNGKPILEYVISSFPSSITEVFVVIDYLGEKIQVYLESKHYGFPVKHIYQKKMKGTAGALWSVENLLHDKFLVVNGDDVFEKKKLETFVGNTYATAVAKKNPPALNYLAVEVDSDSNVSSWREVNSLKEKVLVATGAYMMDKNFFKYAPVEIDRGEYGLPHTLFEISKRTPVKAVVMDSLISVNTPRDLKKAQGVHVS